jgi:PPOX class probable F420-dependent enzyme
MQERGRQAMPELNDREQFLAQAHVAILTTFGPGSRLHAMPVWYLYEDGMFTILTTRGSQKHRNIERHQDVTLVVDRRELPYYAVMVQGKATIGAAPSELRLRMATRYLGAERGAAYTARTARTDSVTIRLRPEKFVEYRGEAGRE